MAVLQSLKPDEWEKLFDVAKIEPNLKNQSNLAADHNTVAYR